MKTTVVFCSQLADAKTLEQKYSKYQILNSACLEKVKLKPNFNNRTSLSKIYNSFLRNVEGTLVLVHDDVLIRDKNWLEKLEKGLQQYDIVGLAGASNATVQPPCLWHLMCDAASRRGCVTHVAENGRDTFPTNFGKQGRVLILDGLFLAFNAKKIRDFGAFFDESNPCTAHFYDIDFCLTCNSKKLKLGTVNIDAVHNSPGLKKYTDEWLSGQAWFMQKYADGKYN